MRIKGGITCKLAPGLAQGKLSARGNHQKVLCNGMKGYLFYLFCVSTFLITPSKTVMTSPSLSNSFCPLLAFRPQGGSEGCEVGPQRLCFLYWQGGCGSSHLLDTKGADVTQDSSLEAQDTNTTHEGEGREKGWKWKVEGRTPEMRTGMPSE